MSGSESDDNTANDIVATGDIVYEGYLVKAPPLNKPGKNWKKRWCVLRSGSHALHYYRNHDSCNQGQKPKGHVKVTLCEPAEPYYGPSKYGNLFCLRSSQRLFLFSAPTKDEMNVWVSKVRIVQKLVIPQNDMKGAIMHEPLSPAANALKAMELRDEQKKPSPKMIYHLGDEDETNPTQPSQEQQQQQQQQQQQSKQQHHQESHARQEPPVAIYHTEEENIGTQQESVYLTGAEATLEKEGEDQAGESIYLSGGSHAPPKQKTDYEDKPWYFGVLGRTKAEKVLRESAAEAAGGMFLVRRSENTSDHAMSWIGGPGSEIVHTRIVQLPNGYYQFNSKRGPPAKPTLSELIDCDEFRAMLVEADKSFQMEQSAAHLSPESADRRASSTKSIQEEFYEAHTPNSLKRDVILAELHSQLVHALPPKVE